MEIPENKKNKCGAFVFETIQHATFCNSISPHQELIDKINGFDLSCHNPNDCLNFVYELKKLVESYG